MHDISTGFDVSLDSGAVEQLLPNGLVYNAWVPIQKPGGYQLRFAIRDRRTGALGAGGAFVLVPEVTDGALALSGLLLRADQRATSYVSLDSDHFSIPPADALREYTQGTVLVFVSEIYNPGKAVEVIATLWRGEDRLMSLLSRTLVPPSGGESLLATGRIELGPQLAPGTYFIQLVATSDDAKRRNKRSAVQRLSFDIKRETQ